VSTSAIRRGLFAAALAAIGTVVLPGVAGAATLNIHPGPSAIQKAINRADGGDTLRIHGGTYPETIEVDKRLTLKGVDGRPLINGRCDAQSTIEAQSNRVALKHLSVRGGDQYGADYEVVSGGSVEDVTFRETCDGALYGINVFQTGHMKLLDNDGKGFTDAGIYVGSLQDIGDEPFVIRGNNMHGNNIGILVEFGADDLDVRVVNNRANGNDLEGESAPAGFRLRGNNDVLLQGNVANDNGDYGFHLDADSDVNTLVDNSGDGNGLFDLFNEGSSNCGVGNSFGSVSGPLGPC
jgi:hypothetical protein